MVAERSRRIPLIDRGVFSLAEAGEYLHVDPKALKEGLLSGVFGIGYWRGEGGRGEFRINRADCDAYIRRRCEEYTTRYSARIGDAA